MKHSVLCRGLALIMAMGLLLVGCGTPKDASYGLNPQEPVAITVWHYYNGSQKVAFDNLVEEFNETTGKELGIVVEATSKGGVNDLIQAVTDSAEGKVGAAEMRREILREVAVLSRSTIPTGMFSICPFPKMVAMKNRQSKGSTTQTPRYRRREVMRCHSRRITMRSAFIA